MERFSLKIVGASGQGVISIGEVLGRAFKRSGYCVFGYREYPSLIKGGHSSYQLDLSGEPIHSTEETIDLLITLNHHGLEVNLRGLKRGGLIVHDTPDWKFSAKDTAFLQKQKIKVCFLPVAQILNTFGAKPILGNVLFSAFVCAVTGVKIRLLKELVGERFKQKQDVLALNMQCIDEGFRRQEKTKVRRALPRPSGQWKDQLIYTGSHAMGMGLIAAGVRFYAGYPMTPSSPLLGFIAEIQNETGMVVKQAEDEITAAQMMSGANFVGTRAVTATSGGGFDLMTETLSLNGMIENPSVFILAQRPGPATGLPTWTAQGDLLLAVNAGHGEFSRCVLSVSDCDDSFTLAGEAFNLAEEFQIPVILMTDKQTAEALCTLPPPDQKMPLRRGRLVMTAPALAKLKEGDRYDPTAKNGISARWLPGAKAATYCAQGDEHSMDGTVDESAENTRLQFDKRLKKMEALEKKLPEPELFLVEREKRKEKREGENLLPLSTYNFPLDLLIVGWGSTKGPVLDVMGSLVHSPQSLVHHPRIGYLHFTYLWPLKTRRFVELAKKAKKIVFVEGNATGQLQSLLMQKTGIVPDAAILKYDGRPFFFDELLSEISGQLSVINKKKTHSLSTVH